MEQELLKDEIDAADDRPAEDLADEAAPASAELEPPASEFPTRDPEDMHLLRERPAVPLEVVDPYTAAAPSPGSEAPRHDRIEPGPNSVPTWEAPVPFRDPFVPIPYSPATPDETIRRSGLAWSAGVAFFGSVAFTLFLGWLGDLLLGTSPWGIVGGIILGSVIGFLQFFRITSQIFPSKPGGPVEATLIGPKDDEQP